MAVITRASVDAVTAKLSKLFYERLGEQIANELVDWFNLVDASYRADLRELNELNFARFEAKLGERLAELRSELDNRLARVREDLLDRIRDTKVSLVRWMFGFWVGTALAIIGSRLIK